MQTLVIHPQHSAPLYAEAHPEGYDGCPFITMIQYNKRTLLTIVDNIDDTNIRAYVIDLCGPQGVDIEGVLTVAEYWYNNNRDKHPVSIEFSRNDLTEITSLIYRSFNLEYVSRLVGPLTVFDMKPTKATRRRKRKDIPQELIDALKDEKVVSFNAIIHIEPSITSS